MWFEDGQQVRLWGFSGIAIGWLERGHRFRTGTTSTNVVDRLCNLLKDLTWNPVHYLGSHSCDLGVCGLRSRVRSSLDSISATLVPRPLGHLAEKIREQASREVERDALIRKSMARHHRRHSPENMPSQQNPPSLGTRLRFKTELLCAETIDTLAKGVRSSIYVVLRAIDPRTFPHTQRWRSTEVKIGNSNLCIPGLSHLYIAPSTVVHYILVHHYRPPDEFCEAVLKCPQIGSRAYFEDLKTSVDKPDLNAWVEDMLEEVTEHEVFQLQQQKSRSFGT